MFRNQFGILKIIIYVFLGIWAIEDLAARWRCHLSWSLKSVSVELAAHARSIDSIINQFKVDLCRLTVPNAKQTNDVKKFLAAQPFWPNCCAAAA